MSDLVNYEASRYGHNLKIALRALLNRIYTSAQREKSVVEQFHKLYYDANLFGKTWRETYWMGAHVAKCPLDLWLYQEIIFRNRPDVIVECGTLHGGSAGYMASLCDLVGSGRIVTIDVREREGRPVHDRITYLTGSSTDAETVARVRAEIKPGETVMGILDSDHRRDHVLDELRIYKDIVTPGQFLIVEDTNLNGHPVAPEFGPGPMEALEAFLEENDEFFQDRETGEKFYLTFNPGGYLVKRKTDS
ncbi:MAG: CmcI family methyltransferase [Rhodothermales bacterium]